ncbi:MAG: ParB N-terminal domain-containing protein, partial [Phycisphaeraceae bacterium]
MTTATYDVQLRKIDDIQPYERNPRINDQAVDAVAASLAEFGFRQPIVVDEGGVIIVGHTRWKAAKKLGLAKVPVHVATDLSPEQIRAYRIADNKTGELADWDLEILPIELNELREGGFDMGVLAFDDEELAKLLDQGHGVTEGLTDADAVPEPPDDPTTQRGDLWVLGDHRLLCGDSGSVEDLDRLLDGNTIDLVNMDPPYNVKVEPRSNNAIAAGNSSFKASGKKQTHHQKLDLARHPGKARGTHKQMRAKDRPLENDFVTTEAFDEMLLAWFGNASRVLKPGGSFYIWGGYANLGNYPGPLKASGFYFSQGIVWDKQHP